MFERQRGSVFTRDRQAQPRYNTSGIQNPGGKKRLKFVGLEPAVFPSGRALTLAYKAGFSLRLVILIHPGRESMSQQRQPCICMWMLALPHGIEAKPLQKPELLERGGAKLMLCVSFE